MKLGSKQVKLYGYLGVCSQNHVSHNIKHTYTHKPYTINAGDPFALKTNVNSLFINIWNIQYKNLADSPRLQIDVVNDPHAHSHSQTEAQKISRHIRWYNTSSSGFSFLRAIINKLSKSIQSIHFISKINVSLWFLQSKSFIYFGLTLNSDENCNQYYEMTSTKKNNMLSFKRIIPRRKRLIIHVPTSVKLC